MLVTLGEKAIENVRKGGNVGYKHILLFTQFFLPFQRKNSSFIVWLILSSANVFQEGKQPVAWKEYCAEYW